MSTYNLPPVLPPPKTQTKAEVDLESASSDSEFLASVLEYCQLAQKQLACLHSTDAIKYCEAETLALLDHDPREALAYADHQLRSWPYSGVKLQFRRLFEDASIVLALRTIAKNVQKTQTEDTKGEPHPRSQVPAHSIAGSHDGVSKTMLGKRKDLHETMEYDWLIEVVSLLDMAIIMTGAPHRAKDNRDIFELLQSYVHRYVDPFIHLSNGVSQSDAGSSHKRREAEDGSHHIPGSDDFPTQDCNYKAPRIQQHPGYKSSGSSRPYVLQETMKHWPALDDEDRRWAKPSYLLERTLGGRRLVPIETGRSYTDEGWGQKIISFGDFLTKYVTCEKSQDNSDGVTTIAYLAQHDLLTQIPALRNDIAIPDHVWTHMASDTRETSDSVPERGKQAHNEKRPDHEEKEGGQPGELSEPLINTWFGPAGTITPLHTDPYDNILCQVVGKKYIRLYSPKETPSLFPRGTEKHNAPTDDGNSQEREIDMSNTSSIPTDVVEMGSAAVIMDLKDDDDQEALMNRIEIFEKAPYMDLVLGEGEALFIPRGWWHYVRSLTISFSVSFWWK